MSEWESSRPKEIANLQIENRVLQQKYNDLLKDVSMLLTHIHYFDHVNIMIKNNDMAYTETTYSDDLDKLLMVKMRLPRWANKL